jgi:hypothetical protein
MDKRTGNIVALAVLILVALFFLCVIVGLQTRIVITPAG